MFWEEESPSGYFLVIVSVQAFFNSCFLLTAVIIPSVIHGLFCITRLVMRGFTKQVSKISEIFRWNNFCYF